MNITEKKNLLDALKRTTVQVTFKKIDSDEIRVMPCTLNKDILEKVEANGSVTNINLESDHFAVWSLDKDAWRSFRLNTVVSWEVISE